MEKKMEFPITLNVNIVANRTSPFTPEDFKKHLPNEGDTLNISKEEIARMIIEGSNNYYSLIKRSKNDNLFLNANIKGQVKIDIINNPLINTDSVYKKNLPIQETDNEKKKKHPLGYTPKKEMIKQEEEKQQVRIDKRQEKEEFYANKGFSIKDSFNEYYYRK